MGRWLTRRLNGDGHIDGDHSFVVFTGWIYRYAYWGFRIQNEEVFINSPPNRWRKLYVDEAEINAYLRQNAQALQARRIFRGLCRYASRRYRTYTGYIKNLPKMVLKFGATMGLPHSMGVDRNTLPNGRYPILASPIGKRPCLDEEKVVTRTVNRPTPKNRWVLAIPTIRKRIWVLVALPWSKNIPIERGRIGRGTVWILLGWGGYAAEEQANNKNYFYPNWHPASFLGFFLG